MLAGANIIYGLGMLEMGMTISYSQLLMDAEMAEMMLFSMDAVSYTHLKYRATDKFTHGAPTRDTGDEAACERNIRNIP